MPYLFWVKECSQKIDNEKPLILLVAKTMNLASAAHTWCATFFKIYRSLYDILESFVILFFFHMSSNIIFLSNLGTLPPLPRFLNLRWIYRRRALTRIVLPAQSEKEKRRRIGNLGIGNARPWQRYALLYVAWRISSLGFHKRSKEVQKHII